MREFAAVGLMLVIVLAIAPGVELYRRLPSRWQNRVLWAAYILMLVTGYSVPKNF